MADSEQNWIARLTPPAGSSVATLLDLPLGLDVWERHAGYLVVAAPESRLAELERRRLATVDRWAAASEYAAGHRAAAGSEADPLEPPPGGGG